MNIPDWLPSEYETAWRALADDSELELPTALAEAQRLGSFTLRELQEAAHCSRATAVRAVQQLGCQWHQGRRARRYFIGPASAVTNKAEA